MDFETKLVRVSVPKFGKAQYDAQTDPLVVSFKNASQHALEASQSHEAATIALFAPRIAYGNNGVIESITCRSAQILSRRS